MTLPRMSRRTLLRGAGGAAVALPFLEAMMPRSAKAAEGAIPTRYVFCYAGISSGRAYTANEGENLVPDQYGDLADVGSEMYSLAPVFDQGVAGDMTLVSNLLMPWGTSESNVPPGGRLASLEFHFGPTVTPQLSGIKALIKGRMEGASSDQLVAQAIGTESLFESLQYRVQPHNYKGGGTGAGRLSYRDSEDGIVPLDPIVSPRLAFESLFSSFTPPDASDAELAAVARRVSVLDRVADSTESLLGRVGRADRIRMERHLHEVRQLELQVSEGALGSSAACVVPRDPGEDPAIGQSTSGDEPLSGSAGWSDEETRANVLTDMLHMALTCDMTRVSTLMYTFWKSWMSAAHIGQGWPIDIHEIGHSGGMPREAYGDTIAWHIRHFARLTRKLAETEEFDGTSVLDHSALLLAFEGGYGADALSGGASTHSTENMSMLVAGRAGGLRSGLHIDGQQRNPAQVTLTGMRAAGYEGNFGDLSEDIPELLG